MPSSSEREIDLNADLGEGGVEEPLYAWISSANIACGGHTGDEASMGEAVRLARRHGVALGAHPSYPDRPGFGRVTVALPMDALARAIAGQIASLQRVAEQQGASVVHVKPHGALYVDASVRPDVACAIADGAAMLSGPPRLVGLADSSGLEIWRRRGCPVAAEGFADRTYADDGSLVPRASSGALILDPSIAGEQAVRLAESGRCDTICIHGDTPGAAAIAAAVRAALERAGFVVRAPAPARG
jgi:UPF0271 protein